MEITGYKSRYIYPQTGIINYQISLSYDNITGYSAFGFSGKNLGNKLEFVCKSGKFYLNESSSNYLYLQSYQPNEQILVSGAISGSVHDLFYNGSPLLLKRPKATGILDLFYVDSSQSSTNISLSIQGDSPEYTYDPFESFFSGQNIPVQIVNNSPNPFKIFSGNSLNSNFTLSGANNVSVTGAYNLYLQANRFSKGSQSIPIELFTDFGTQRLSFTASGQSLDDVEFYILLGPNIPSIQSYQAGYYTISCRNSTGINLKLDFEYVSGATGKYYNTITSKADLTGSASGLITGSGFLSSLETGTISFDNPLTGIETGIGSGNLNKFVYSSGDIHESFETILTGLGSGLLPRSSTGTGYTSVDINTTVGPNGGIVNFSNLSSFGSGSDPEYGVFSGDIYQGAVSIFVPYTGSVTGIQIVAPVGSYENVNFTGDLIYYTGEITKFYSITGVTYVTGEIVTGLLQGDFGNIFEPGIYTFYKGFTGIGSGEQAILESFDPIGFKIESTGTSGIISGIFSTGIDARYCEFETSDIIPIGIPWEIFGPTGNRAYPLSIFHLEPNDTGEYSNENSYGVAPRTQISRNGITASGSGFFDNIFREPFYEDGTWTEYIAGNTTLKTGNNRAYTKNLCAELQMVNSTGLSGSFTISGVNNYYQSYKWNGGIVSGDFNDYSLELYKQVGSNSSLLKRFSSSHEIDLILNNGIYNFNIIPIVDSVETPSILVPDKLYFASSESYSNIPVILSQNTNDAVYFNISGEDVGSAIENINYRFYDTQVSFDKNFGVKYIPLVILSDPSEDIKFNLHISYVSGGFISNTDKKVIEINILKNSYGDSLAPVNNAGNCCPEPTGIAYVTCDAYLGSDNFVNGKDGVYSNFIKFPRPLSQYESLSFYNSFMGLNDIYSLDAMVSNSQPVSLYSSTQMVDQQLDVLNKYSIPSTCYGLRYTVLAGALGVKNERSSWENKFSCNNNTQIQTGGNIDTSCKQIAESVTIKSLNGITSGSLIPYDSGLLIYKNSSLCYSGLNVSVKITGVNINDYIEVYSKQNLLEPFSAIIQYSGGGSYVRPSIFNNASRGNSVEIVNGSSSSTISQSAFYKIYGYQWGVGIGSPIPLGTICMGVPFGDDSDEAYNSDFYKKIKNTYGITSNWRFYSQTRRTYDQTAGQWIQCFDIIEYIADISSLKNLEPIKVGDLTVENICSDSYDDCYPTGIRIRSLSYVDDDLYVKIGDKFIYNDKLNVGWYSGQEQIWFPPDQYMISNTSLSLSTGILTFSGHKYNSFSPSSGEKVWLISTGNNAKFYGTAYPYANPLGSYIEINLVTEFPYGGGYDPAGWPYGAGKNFGPYTKDYYVYSHSADPAGADDDIAIDGTIIYGNNYTDYINGGATTFIKYLPKGSSFNINIWNAVGNYGGIGKFRLYDGTNIGMSVIPDTGSINPYLGQTHSGWLIANTDFGQINKTYTSGGFRDITISRTQAKLNGVDFTPGSQVDVGVFDGWGGSAQASQWSGYIMYTNGSYALKNGESKYYTSTMQNVPSNSTGQLKYYSVSPTFEQYYPNGGFII